MDGNNLPIKLHIGSTHLAKLSFCSGHVEDINKWVKKLPLANTGESAKLLYLAVREITQWQTSPQSRFEALEALRPQVYTICGLLNKHFLHSSLALNAKQLKVASLSQTLQNHLASGYKIIIAQLLTEPKKLNNSTLAKILTMSIHRAISDSSQVILRSLQLYSKPAEHLWLEINQLYWLAEAKKLIRFAIVDNQNHFVSSSNIQTAFIRIHLLGAAKPNNMRQKDLNTLYECCELWAPYCQITDANDSHSLFLIHLHKDSSTFYRQQLKDHLKPLFRGLNTETLVKKLKLWSKTNNFEPEFNVPKSATEPLISHIIQAWGTHWQRSFRRSNADGSLSLCLGLSALHYFSAKQIDFDIFLAAIRPHNNGLDKLPANSNLISSQAEDIWAYAFDSDGGNNNRDNDISFDALGFINKNQTTEITDHDSKYSIYQADIINTSPGGYSLRWQGTAPSSLQAGELIGIQSHGLNTWAVGVIRWLRQSNDTQTTHLGVELLGPKAEAGAIQLVQKTGKPYPFVRSLLLPAIHSIDQPASILAPHLPFRTGNKVELLFAELNGRHQLVKRICSTGSFSQFMYRTATPPAAAKPQNIIELEEDNFDSIWNKL